MPVHEEAIARPAGIRLWDVAPQNGFALALHGGAGGLIEELSSEGTDAFEEGLAIAHAAGRAILERGGHALDAVCATVEQLENHRLFNAGRGAALTALGGVEHDASVMDGSGDAGAIAASRHAKNPVYVARSVMEKSPHLFLVSPSKEMVIDWGHETAEQEYFITEPRQRQLARIQASQLVAPRHGTVGAVARDSHGRVAAATSTGGMVNQQVGRVGDTPIIGAGNYARNEFAAISCTGEGEAFIRGVVAYDIVARMRYLGSELPEAVAATVETELTANHSSGGLVSVGGDGRVVVAHNSPRMFAAFEDENGLVLLT
ncbi:MAG: L-asparaginase / beta-aspartyl-peptidase [Microbacteriaceae bacterium]|jgi:beta-aspartyl-peptidase (threonine type)|nr:isoaspartyl dipeptidase with L-asparaginase [Microbacteriaceae bacterium]MDQ1526575.1 L-asparaginase / beta-aspartyl-peptidase [Microbacteriaceae bacterium]MDQ1577553.1 L-asparaginase / beta-aspartyl-peptidase [Microbacteriaceae bacterium]MDQ1605760.1 L-asparaginase / beta-aspartyl-peptidase [Microbacteriaceae bacterium]